VAFGFHYGASELGAMIVPVGAGRTLLQLKLMRDLRTTVLAAIATYPLRLLEVAREERFDLGTLALRVGSSAPRCGPMSCGLGSERELSIRAFDIIGMTETGGPGLGIDCPPAPLPASTSGRTITTSRSWTRPRAVSCPTASRVSWCLGAHP